MFTPCVFWPFTMLTSNLQDNGKVDMVHTFCTFWHLLGQSVTHNIARYGRTSVLLVL